MAQPLRPDDGWHGDYVPGDSVKRWLVCVVLLGASIASAQALIRYMGDRPNGSSGGGSGGASCQALPLTFAWYGDSIVAGTCSPTTPTAKLQSLLGAGWLGSTNAGDGGPPAVGGYSAAQIRARYFATRDTACNGERCGVYLFEGGVNTVVNSGTAASVLADMTAAVDDARALGRKVVWSNIMPCKGSTQCSTINPNAWNEAKAYNTLWAAACNARPDIRCLDVGAGSSFEDAGAPGYLPAALTCDGIHLVQAGTDTFASLAKVAVQQLTEKVCR